MMECDRRAETFSEALFTYLWFTENLVSGSTAAETVGDMSEFIAEVAKAVVVLSALTVPSFNQSMEEYFQRNDMSRRSVFTFLAKYCFDNHAENKDIFCVVLNTCTFVYRLVIFCQHRGHIEYVEFASMCWSEIFEMDLKKDFYANGGWEEFRRYVTENCYVPKDKDTDRKAFINFLNEINYLFPKLKVSENDEEYSFSTDVGICGQLDVGNFDEGSPELLNSGEFGQGSDYFNSSSVFETSDDSADNEIQDANEVAEAAGQELCRMRHYNTSDETSEPESESDEDIFHELVREGLNSIRKINASPPSKDCVVCISVDGTGTASFDDIVCPKHDPDSFYYLATHSENEEQEDES